MSVARGRKEGSMSEDQPLFVEQQLDEDTTDTIEVIAPSWEHLTYTGSFDVRVARNAPFTKLLDALPIPALLLDSDFAIRFANGACRRIRESPEKLMDEPFVALLSEPAQSSIAENLLQSVSSTRRRRVMKGTLHADNGGPLWGRIHFRSLRAGEDRSILALIEDLTHEKTQLELNRKHQDELLRAHAQLEQRVQERTARLREINERLEREIAERKRVEEDLRRHRELLELRVDERTAALKEANERLIAEISQRSDAELARKKSEDKFHTIFQHSLDVILVIDSESGTIDGANEAVRGILQYAVDDIIGKHVSILFPSDDDPEHPVSLERIRPHGAVFEAQQVRRADGSTIPMDLTATTIPWNGGTALLATFRDVGDRENALQALRESEERYRTLFDQAGNAIILQAGRGGKIIDANRAAERLTGYSRERVTALTMEDLIPSNHFLAGGPMVPAQESVPAETVLIRCDGEEVPVMINFAPLHTRGQSLFLFIIHDMRDRKRAELLTLAQRDLSTRLNEVTRLDQALELCVETSIQVSGMEVAGIYLVSRDSCLELAAHRGISEELVPSVSFLDKNVPLAARILKGNPIYSTCTAESRHCERLRNKEGIKAIAALPIPHEDRIIACLAAASRDEEHVSLASRNALEAITPQLGSALARLKAEDALRQAHQELEKRVEERTKQLLDANRRLEEEIAHRKSAEVRMRDSLTEKEALLQEVHHRVKNNLQIISSLLALQGAHVTDEKTLGVLRDSQSRIRSMAFIHEHLYRSADLARIDFGQYIRDLMGALFQSYSEVAGRVSLKLEIEPAFLDVGTALPCGLIINEIVSNCLKHAFPENRSGEVRVSLSRGSEDGFELLVQDDGIGFDGETEFHRSASLGLRLVKNLTEFQLKGSLQMSSDAGTRVKILFRDRR